MLSDDLRKMEETGVDFCLGSRVLLSTRSFQGKKRYITFEVVRNSKQLEALDYDMLDLVTGMCPTSRIPLDRLSAYYIPQ